MLSWKKEFELGIEEIDAQHKKLVEIGGRLFELVKDDSKEDYFDEILDTLRELENYTVEHFAYEESELARIDYIGLVSHKFEHKLFVKKLESYTKDLVQVDDNQRETLLELLNFVSDWLIKHIDKTDREYVIELK